jgi:enhancing lycopene biosynthesis protein 2
MVQESVPGRWPLCQSDGVFKQEISNSLVAPTIEVSPLKVMLEWPRLRVSIFCQLVLGGFSMGSTKPVSQRVALVLAGCGSRDGAEITEAVSLLIALTQGKFEVHCFAPDRPQHHTLNHLTQAEEPGPGRNMLVEAARIARCEIQSLSELKVDQFGSLVFGGGFGVAKNLCNFAFAGADATLMPDVKEVLLPFLRAQKPVAALCIAPVLLGLAAREMGWKGARLTLGDGSAKDAIAALESWGARHVACRSGEACLDETHRLISSPAFMIDGANWADIYACATALTAKLRQLVG